MGKIDTAFELVKASWGVLRQDRQLLVLPVISGLCALAVIASFAYPVITIIIAENENLAGGDISYPPAALFLAFVGYLIVTFVGMFFNSALIHAANERMEGGEPTLGSALGGAWARVFQILAWAMVASTVSVLIRQMQERLGLLGKLLGFLAGTAWAVVTFLVLPIIIIEGLEPIDAAKRSVHLLRRSWGENLAGHASLGIVNFIVVAFAIGFMLLGLMISPAAIIFTGPLALFALVVSFIVMSALSTVFQTALYRHAVDLPVGGFDPRLMNDAFTFKKGAAKNRPSRASDLQRVARQQQAAGTPPPPASANTLDGPQDWSKLPDEWK